MANFIQVDKQVINVDHVLYASFDEIEDEELAERVPVTILTFINDDGMETSVLEIAGESARKVWDYFKSISIQL